ncbi:reverse transcriptase domain-containing protein [Tanacetum coccineum]
MPMAEIPPSGEPPPIIPMEDMPHRLLRAIKDYPLPDGLKMPSHVGSYDGKRDPDNYLHLFEGAIRMQKWAMPVACHMFTYTLKDSTRIWWNSQKAGSILNYEDLKAKFRSHFSQQKKFTKTHLAVHNIRQREGESIRAFNKKTCGLPTTYKGLMEKTYTWIEAREVSTNGTPNDHREGFDRFKKNSSWDNNKGKKNRDRFSTYRGSNHGLLSSLSKSPREILAIEKIEEAVKSGQLAHLVKVIKKGKEKVSDTQLGEWRKGDKDTAPFKAPIIMISVNNSSDQVIIKFRVSERQVNWAYMDRGSSCEVIYEHCFLKLKPSIISLRVYSKVPLVGFSREHSWPLGEVTLEITIGKSPFIRTEVLNFVIVRSDSPHNLILGRTAMQRMGIVVSIIHRAKKFHTPRGVGTIFSTYEPNKIEEGQKKLKKPLRRLRRSNADVFAWTCADMTGILRIIMLGGNPFNTEHRLNEFKHIEPVKQKKRGLAPERNEAICKEVEELTNANILREVKYIMLGRNYVKGQILADFLAETPSAESKEKGSQGNNRRRKGTRKHVETIHGWSIKLRRLWSSMTTSDKAIPGENKGSPQRLPQLFHGACSARLEQKSRCSKQTGFDDLLKTGQRSFGGSPARKVNCTKRSGRHHKKRSEVKAHIRRIFLNGYGVLDVRIVIFKFLRLSFKIRAFLRIFTNSDMLGSKLQGEDFAKKMVDLLRKLSFEEVKEEFDKLIKQIESFAPISFEATKDSLKRFGEELQTKTPKRLKEDKDDEAKDDEPTKKLGRKKTNRPEKVLKTPLNPVPGDDLTELYRIVMNRYGLDGPEDKLEKGFWKCLRIMFEEPLSTDSIWSEIEQQKIKVNLVEQVKDDYDTWAMEMELYLSKIDNEVWKVIHNGNSKKRVTKVRLFQKSSQAFQWHGEMPRDLAAIKRKTSGGESKLEENCKKAILKQHLRQLLSHLSQSLFKQAQAKPKLREFISLIDPPLQRKPTATPGLADEVNQLVEQTTDEELNHALMAFTVNNEVSMCSKLCLDSYNALQAKYDELQSEFGNQEAALVAHKIVVKKEQEDIDDSLYEYGKYGPQSQSSSHIESDASSTVSSTCQSNDSDGEQGTVSDHSVNDDPIPIPSSEQVSTSIQKTQPQVPKPQQTVDPSCAQHVKTPRQQIRTPVTPSPIPSYNRQNWNQRMERELGAGYSFERKPCFVCGSLSHLIKDYDYYEKKMAREAALKSKKVVHARQATPAWTNTNRVNQTNQFTPRPVQLSNIRPNLSTASNTIKTGRVNVNTGHGNVSSGRVYVNTGTQFKSGGSRFNTGS